ncbi:hypothetical protein A2526_03695 [candidate division WOR-1 bacterium RIFOXYD2_FULL_36_8]|uniref:Fis family transcriptional regulator n=1 Tax=candidate division WOR-1 bacterium RIFOXYB2_FULL_36_35 TaxID=1802578 RepID=A0A1F4S5P3_UNCSA|nr:MAG: hypothetical protein A2230_04965 [candidate division WOR-1 bacterium RIFOXYA2_FULL_36_21]OGC15756.1 MAG: hypothetical protein A2290_05390 [candidate division WOR-1 bacterium RIFOXYB2_FULL_36_35]OGC21111.1 MAG: hypothetical protein A2282_03720 [candidate division WOR-1 bacterium RIFOXYA12_FULL_36_13]OGC39391.1 MAG: hypothetical protein A2526_03695 [candidate division WOR-1 bacterium RIFOXYD2_FULL_36_8]
MREQGIIKRVVSKDIVEVALQRSGGCGRCGACKVLSDGFFGVEAINSIGAKIGDNVILDIEYNNFIWFSAIIYIFPIILFGFGYFLGELFESGIIFAFLFLIVSFILMYLYDKKASDKFSKAKVVALLQK